MIVPLEQVTDRLESAGYTLVRDPDYNDPSSGVVIATRPNARTGATDLIVGKPRKNGEFHPMHIKLSPVEKSLLGIDEVKEQQSLIDKMKDMYT